MGLKVFTDKRERRESRIVSLRGTAPELQHFAAVKPKWPALQTPCGRDF